MKVLLNTRYTIYVTGRTK